MTNPLDPLKSLVRHWGRASKAMRERSKAPLRTERQRIEDAHSAVVMSALSQELDEALVAMEREDRDLKEAERQLRMSAAALEEARDHLESARHIVFGADHSGDAEEAL